MRIYIYLLTLTFSLSCSEKNTTQCSYFEGLDLYMQRVHHISIKDIKGDKIFYFLGLRGCEPCIEKNLAMLSTINENKHLIICLIGALELLQYEQNLNHVNKTHHPILDLKAEIFSYETGFAKLLLVHIKDGKCINIIQITDNEVDNTRMYILKSLFH
jgi:hypothetical protein